MAGSGQEWLAQDKRGWPGKKMVGPGQEWLAPVQEWLAKDKMAQKKNSWPRTRIKLAQDKD